MSGPPLLFGRPHGSGSYPPSSSAMNGGPGPGPLYFGQSPLQPSHYPSGPQQPMAPPPPQASAGGGVKSGLRTMLQQMMGRREHPAPTQPSPSPPFAPPYSNGQYGPAAYPLPPQTQQPPSPSSLQAYGSGQTNAQSHSRHGRLQNITEGNDDDDEDNDDDDDNNDEGQRGGAGSGTSDGDDRDDATTTNNNNNEDDSPGKRGSSSGEERPANAAGAGTLPSSQTPSSQKASNILQRLAYQEQMKSRQKKSQVSKGKSSTAAPSVPSSQSSPSSGSSGRASSRKQQQQRGLEMQQRGGPGLQRSPCNTQCRPNCDGDHWINPASLFNFPGGNWYGPGLHGGYNGNFGGPPGYPGLAVQYGNAPPGPYGPDPSYAGYPPQNGGPVPWGSRPGGGGGGGGGWGWGWGGGGAPGPAFEPPTAARRWYLINVLVAVFVFVIVIAITVVIATPDDSDFALGCNQMKQEERDICRITATRELESYRIKAYTWMAILWFALGLCIQWCGCAGCTNRTSSFAFYAAAIILYIVAIYFAAVAPRAQVTAGAIFGLIFGGILLLIVLLLSNRWCSEPEEQNGGLNTGIGSTAWCDC